MWSRALFLQIVARALRRLPTRAGVLVGPGEIPGHRRRRRHRGRHRIESHNHPSAIEPHQGAATGVGGSSGTFSHGARPLAVMDPLFFGPLTDGRQRWLFEGVVGGISSYGNSSASRHRWRVDLRRVLRRQPPRQRALPRCAPVERLVLSAASGPGNLAVLLGSATGRDGIGGVSVLASAGFSGEGAEPDDAKRPSVQVGDRSRRSASSRPAWRCSTLGSSRDPGPRRAGSPAPQRDGWQGGVGMDVDVSAVPRARRAWSPGRS